MKYKYFKLAKQLSQKSIYKHKLGAVIVKRNNIIGVGFNSIKTHTKSSSPFHTLHAEISALISCGLEDTNGAIIYVYRQMKNGEPAAAKCCEYCLNSLKKAGVIKVFFTTSSFPFYEEMKIS